MFSEDYEERIRKYIKLKDGLSPLLFITYSTECIKLIGKIKKDLFYRYFFFKLIPKFKICKYPLVKNNSCKQYSIRNRELSEKSIGFPKLFITVAL